MSCMATLATRLARRWSSCSSGDKRATSNTFCSSAAGSSNDASGSGSATSPATSAQAESATSSNVDAAASKIDGSIGGARSGEGSTIKDSVCCASSTGGGTERGVFTGCCAAISDDTARSIAGSSEPRTFGCKADVTRFDRTSNRAAKEAAAVCVRSMAGSEFVGRLEEHAATKSAQANCNSSAVRWTLAKLSRRTRAMASSSALC